jgi:hypothetical protein
MYAPLLSASMTMQWYLLTFEKKKLRIFQVAACNAIQ